MSQIPRGGSRADYRANWKWKVRIAKGHLNIENRRSGQKCEIPKRLDTRAYNDFHQ